MKLTRFPILVGIIAMALVGLVTASPVHADAIDGFNGTRTIANPGTPIGPRRNGHSDLPLTVQSYNSREPLNRIPDYIMGTNTRRNATDRSRERNAILYSASEIYQALSQGYELLQRSRDPINPGQAVTYANVAYPNQIDIVWYDLDTTDLGRFNYDNVGHWFTWPLTWAGTWTGHNQHPGDDRVVFNDDGVYLGVLTRRTIEEQLLPGGENTYRWCAATDNVGRWISVWESTSNGWQWDYPGQPPDGVRESLLGYQRPDRWLTAYAQRTLWYKYHPGVPPFGGGTRFELDPDGLLPLEFFHEAMWDNTSNPLDWPSEDNSTGTWRTFVPSELKQSVLGLNNNSVSQSNNTGNFTGNTSETFNPKTGLTPLWRNGTEWSNDTEVYPGVLRDTPPGYDPSCAWAANHSQKFYWQSCQAAFLDNQLKYRITISGTGRATDTWCANIMSWILVNCGAWADKIVQSYSCNTEYKGTLAWIDDPGSSWPEAGAFAYGIDLHFQFNWPWCAGDSNHQCVSGAIEQASCGESGVTPTNGLWCRDVAYVNSSEVEYGQDFGTPAGHC